MLPQWPPLSCSLQQWHKMKVHIHGAAGQALSRHLAAVAGARPTSSKAGRRLASSSQSAMSAHKTCWTVGTTQVWLTPFGWLALAYSPTQSWVEQSQPIARKCATSQLCPLQQHCFSIVPFKLPFKAPFKSQLSPFKQRPFKPFQPTAS